MEVAEKEPKENAEKVLPENNIVEQTSTNPPQELPKKSKKDDRSKKDDKNVEQFMKSLNSVPLDEKFSSVCKKYVQAADDNKKLQFYIKQSDKRYAVLSKEKEQLQHEFNKTILLKSKLENLCRELQKQNKAIKEESLLKIREEEERRKETQTKFQNTLSEITTLLQQNNEKNAKLRDDNISMTEKFKSVVQQYQLREQQVDKMAKQMALESQLSDAKLQKASLEHQAERERMLAEMEQMKVTLAQYRAKIMEFQGTESALKGQLAIYTDKYDEFQNAMVKSNQVFGGFKEQMEKMSKKIQKLEKESLSWKKRWETSQSALLGVCAERQASEDRAAAATSHLHHMQGLCRTLQADRNTLLSILKEHNIERPPLPTPPPAAAPTPPPPASNAKVDAMAANCAQLRQSLAHLQTQLNVLTNKKEEPPKPETKKKSKSKKKSEKQAQKKQERNEVKEQETQKESPEDSTPSAEEVAVPNDETDEKINNTTMENIIQAMNMTSINISGLEDEKKDGEGVIVTEVLEEPVLESNNSVDKVDDPSKETTNNAVDETKVTQTVLTEFNTEITDSVKDIQENGEQQIKQLEKVSNDESAEVCKETLDEVSKDESVEVCKEKLNEVSKDECAEVSKEKISEVSKDECAEVSKEKLDEISKDKSVEVSKDNLDEVSKDNLDEVSKDSNVLNKNVTVGAES